MIRPAESMDTPALLALAREMHAESPAYRDWPFNENKVVDLLRNLRSTGCVLVAEVGGEVVGGVAGVLTEHWFSSAKIASDLALFVSPSDRNGITALRLTRAFIKWAELFGAKRVTMGITTGVHPDATGRLYQAAGLAPSGQLYAKDF